MTDFASYLDTKSKALRIQYFQFVILTPVMASLNYASGYVTSKNNGFLDMPFWASVVLCGLASALLTYLLLPTLTKRGKPLPDYVSRRGVTWIVFWSSVMFCGLVWMVTSMIGGALQ